MRILVTGGLGAVGVPLTQELRGRGHEVWVSDRAHHHEPRDAHEVRDRHLRPVQHRHRIRVQGWAGLHVGTAFSITRRILGI